MQAAVAARGDAPRLRAALAAAAQALAAAEAAVADALSAPDAPAEPPAPPEPEPDADDGPPVRLPLARHPFGLVLGAPPAGFETGQLAALLEVDLATARAALLAGGARIVLRGAARADLERRVAALRGAGLDACVVDRDELLAPGPARALVAASRADVWRVAEVPRWGEERPDPSQLMRGEPWVPAAPRLLVPGEVDEKRLREAPASSRWQRAHYAPVTGAGGEVRVAVLDVHTDDGIFRVVEGAVDLRELAGVEAGSARKALKALQDALSAQWPEVRVEARRTCAATPRAGMPHRADGWAAFEEHSRACRRLWLGATAVRTPGEPTPS